MQITIIIGLFIITLVLRRFEKAAAQEARMWRTFKSDKYFTWSRIAVLFEVSKMFCTALWGYLAFGGFINAA
ncbi:MAG: hypothetical protein OQJ95_06510 [Kangiella sp.]|nr:hypothetical protein [Kangiella sp.]MCW9029233.1 hypothetical protein [Kangiella sp.]